MSGEDGSSAKAVFTSTVGAFSLSPDARTLVVAQGSTANPHAVLVDVASLAQVQIPLATDLPTWAPDSSWLAYSAGSGASATIRRVNRDGAQDQLIPIPSPAAGPAISPDAKRIAYAQSQDSTQPVEVWDIAARKSKVVPNSQGASSFVFAASGVLYFVKPAGERTMYSANASVSKSSVIASLPVGTERQSPGQLFPSPDGSKILFGMIGDDGNNSLTIADIGNKTIRTLTTPRRAATPIGWLLDGSAILYIDGNPTITGETTALRQISPTGSNIKLIKDGAGL